MDKTFVSKDSKMTKNENVNIITEENIKQITDMLLNDDISWKGRSEEIKKLKKIIKNLKFDDSMSKTSN